MKERGSFVLEQETLLFLIGSWYHKWLSSDINEFVLRVPYYKKDVVSSLIEYQYWLDLFIKITSLEPLSDLSGQGLFDIKAYTAADRYQRQNMDFMIDHHSSDSKMHQFGKDINVSTDRFLPLFQRDQTLGREDLLYHIFTMLKVLGRDNLLPYPVKLDMDRNLTLFVKQTAESLTEKAFARMLFTENFRDDDDKRDAVLDELSATDLQRCIVLTYPYHVDVSSAVINEFRDHSKIFHISLANRFAHAELDDHELILTNPEVGKGQDEEIINVTDRFSVRKTGCCPELITTLRAFRYDWNLSKFNTFTTPYPVKWLLCVHKGHTLDFWKVQFTKDYPEISGQLLANSRRIIELIYELNWIDHFLSSDEQGTLVLPKSTIHAEVIISLKEHLSNRFEEIVLTDEIDRVLAAGNRVYLLDPFNIILFNNITLVGNPENFQIIVPDFLFYTYQPFIRYLALKYHFDALTGGLRERFDELYIEHLASWTALSETTLRAARQELRQFNSIASVKEEEEQLNEQLETIVDLSAAELVERTAVKERKSYERALPNHIDIITDRRNLSLRPNAPVLIKQNGILIRTIATILDSGVMFIPIGEVIKNMDRKSMIDRLVTLSDKARNWHQNLKALDDQDAGIFDLLKSHGLSISKQTFEKDYLTSNEKSGELHMPRAKQDWMIICERLQITDSQTAWNAVKCREDINLLKTAYSQIISLMIDTGSFGINVSDTVLDQVTAMLSKLPDPADNANENKRDAIALIAEICDKINLEKIEQINRITL